MRISKSIEFEYGHRIPHHKSKCRSMHGHHGKVVVRLRGDVVTRPGASEEGMLMDFSDVKEIATKRIHDPLDHGFIVYERDEEALSALRSVKDNKTVVVPFVPTAENLAKWCFEILESEYRSAYGNRLELESVDFYETPTSVAQYSRDDFVSDPVVFVRPVKRGV